MKKILSILVLACAISTLHAQYIPNAGAYQYKGLEALKSLQIPTGCNTPVTSINAPDSSRSAVFYDSCNNRFYLFNPSDKTWGLIAGGSSGDTAKLIQQYGILILNADSTYKPNGQDVSIGIDTLLMRQFINIVNAGDTTIGQVINNADFIVKFHSNSPPADAEGDQTLVGTAATGLFTGHENEIATKVGAAYTFVTASAGDNLIVNNAAAHVFESYRFNGSTWDPVNVVIIAGGNAGVGSIPIGTYDANDVYFITKNLSALKIDTNQNVSLPKFIGTPSNNYLKVDSATGNIDTAFFKELIAGTNITISPGATADTISALGGDFGADGLIQPGYVTWSGAGLTFDVTGAIYRINGVVYTSVAGSVTLSTADPSNPRIDVIAVDTLGNIVAIAGDAGANPSIPQVDPASQTYLTSILVPAGATTPSITQTIIYDQNTENFTGTTSGITLNLDNTTNPYHLTKSAVTGSSTATRNITFTQNSGTSDASDYSILKLYIWLKQEIATNANIRISFLNGTTVVSNVVTLSSVLGLTKTLDSNWQNITIPMNAFTFTNNTFNKVRLTVTGTQSGMYFDYFQLQSGIFPPGDGNPYVVNYSKNTLRDSTILLLSNGQRFAAKDSVGAGDTSHPIESIPIYTNGSNYPITLTTAGLIVPYARTIILDSLWTTYDGTPYYSGLASIVNAPDGDTVELQLLNAYDSSYITGGSSVVSNSYAYTVAGSTEYDFTTNQYNLTKDGNLAYASTSIAGSAFGKSATFDGTQPSYVGTTGLTGSRSVNFPANTGTIECFFKLTSLGKNQALICKWGDGNSTVVDSYILYVNSSNQLVATFKKTTNANIAVTGSTTLTTGTLYHAAWVLTSTTSTLFLNGVSDGTTSWSGGINAAATTSFTIGKDSVTDANPYLALFGSIDEVRISSINRYGGTFTVPTAPFVADANTISLIHFDNTQPSLYSGTAIIKTPFVNMSTTYKSILYKVINHQANRANLINLTLEIKYVP